MHELGVLLQVVEQVEEVAAQNQVEKIKTLVLQVGEISAMIPRYMQKLYPAAVSESVLEGSELKIEIIPANGRCRECKNVFSLTENKGVCPHCQSENFEMISGREFFIKEIVCE